MYVRARACRQIKNIPEYRWEDIVTELSDDRWWKLRGAGGFLEVIFVLSYFATKPTNIVNAKVCEDGCVFDIIHA